MPDESASNKGMIDEELVAYLDGELDAEASRRIEARLSQEPKLRAQLQRLERAWGMLDKLETPPLTAQFAQSTMQMVAVAATEDAAKTQAAIPQLDQRRWGIVLGSFLAAGLLGVLIVGLLLPNPNKQLFRDLPVLVSFQHYCYQEGTRRYFENYEFLEQLHGAGLFEKDTESATTGDPPRVIADGVIDADEAMASHEADKPVDQMSRAEKKRFVKNMTSEEKIHLANMVARFDDLSADKKQEVRKLHEQLQSNADLRRVMQRYHRWLVDLPENQRTTILNESDPQSRIAKIEELLVKDAKPSPEDTIGMMNWMTAYVRGRDPKIEQKFKELEREFVQMPKRAQRRAIFYLICVHLKDFDENHLRLSSEELKKLRSHLSRETQQQFERKPERLQTLVLSNWIQQTRQKLSGRGFFEFVLGISDAELDEFASTLSPEERSWFARMEKGEMRRIYLGRIKKQVDHVLRGGPMPGYRPGVRPGVVRPGPGPFRNPGGRFSKPPDQGHRPKIDEGPRPKFGHEPRRDFPPPHDQPFDRNKP